MCYCSGKTTCEGLEIDGITSHICQERLIHESTHIPDDSFSFINSIFTSQPNLATESSLHSSLHENCYRQKVFSKFNLKVFYPSPYMRRLAFQYVSICLSYQKKAISNFQWERMFANMNINEMAYFYLNYQKCSVSA